MLKNPVLPLLVILLGCGDKAPPAAAGDGEAAPPRITAEIPDTANARRFAGRLIETEVTNWQIVGGSGASLTYQSLTFLPDGRWNASALLAAGFEDFECHETGTWGIESADTGESATMVWDLVKSTCPTRDAGTSLRVHVLLARNGTTKISFR